MISIKKINVNLAGEAINLPEDINLTNGSIVGIYFKDSNHKERFVNAFKGGDTKRLIGTLQAETKKKGQVIDYVDENLVESTLSVSEYLKLYGMVKNIYDIDFPNKINNLLYKINLLDKREESMIKLKRSQQKSVRVLASCLNNLLLFVGNNLLNEMDNAEKDRLYDVISYYLKDIAVCIVLEDSKENLNGFADVIYEI